MARRLKSGERLVVASHNPGKIASSTRFSRRRRTAVSAAALGLGEPGKPAPRSGNAALAQRRRQAGSWRSPMIRESTGPRQRPGSIRRAGPAQDFGPPWSGSAKCGRTTSLLSPYLHSPAGRPGKMFRGEAHGAVGRRASRASATTRCSCRTAMTRVRRDGRKAQDQPPCPALRNLQPLHAFHN